MLARRRIGFDAIRALRNTTGLGNYSRGVLRGLHRREPGIDIHLYAPDPGRAEFRDLAGELAATVHLPLASTNPIAQATWRTFRLGRDAARDGIELYHGLTHEIPRDLPRTGIPSVVTIHDLIFEKHPSYFPFFDRASYRWRYRWSVSHATAVVAVSEQTRHDLVQWYGTDPARIAVIPPARYPGFAMPIPDAGRAAIRAKHGVPADYLLSVGTLSARKNHGMLLAALAAIGPADGLPLVLIGRDGGALRALQRDVVRLGLTGRVWILSDVATAELPALMQSAAIFLSPSLVEGFGMPIVEALSAGVPVIASEGGCFAEAGGRATRYVPATDPAAWAAAILQLLGDSHARTQMSELGQRWAARFDGDRLATQLAAVYDAVLAGVALPAPLPTAEVAMDQIR